MQTHAIWFAVLAVLAVGGKAVPLDSDELERMTSCKELCGSCNCLGFYCGEECLCECDGEGDDDTECIENIQDTCERMQLPYEVLIQGSRGNRLVRSLYADPSQAAAAAAESDESGVCIAKDPLSRKQRSTFSIYRPSETTDDSNGAEPHPATDDSVESIRAVQQMLSEVKAVEAELEKDDNELKHKRATSDGNDDSEKFKREADDEPSEVVEVEEVAAPAEEVVDLGEVSVVEEDNGANEEESELGSPKLEEKICEKILPPPPTTTLAPTKKEIIKAKLEEFKNKLVEADTLAISAIKAKKEELKSKLLADIADKKAKAEELKSKFTSAIEASKIKVDTPIAPAPVAVAPVVVPGIKKFDWFKKDKDVGDVGMAAPGLEAEIATKDLEAETKALLLKLKLKAKLKKLELQKKLLGAKLGLGLKGLGLGLKGLGAPAPDEGLEDDIDVGSPLDAEGDSEVSIVVQPSETVDEGQ